MTEPTTAERDVTRQHVGEQSTLCDTGRTKNENTSMITIAHRMYHGTPMGTNRCAPANL